MSEILFLDTSAILDGALKAPHNEGSRIYISAIVLNELEKIKNSERGEHIKYLAREAVRKILNHEEYLKDSLSFAKPDYRKVKRFFKKYPFLESELNDHKLLAEAALLQQQRNEFVFFVTSDATLWLFAKQIQELNGYNGAPILFEKQEENPVDYKGWNDYRPSTEQLASIYSNPNENVLGAKTNEFCKIYEGSELRDIVFWDGEKYRPLKYENIKNKFLGEVIKPRNLEQKFAFDLLQNRDIPVKLLVGRPGSGKDYLMLLHALDLVKRGEKDKIVFIRNLVPFKDAPEIGFIKGDEQSKIAWGLGPIRSILGEEGLIQAQEEGIIEAVNLGFIRGMSWDNTIIYVSEGQNITGGGYKLLVSRLGKNAEAWINGDILQTDDKKFEKNNGIERLIKSLTNNKCFGLVHLEKTERSEVAELAAII